MKTPITSLKGSRSDPFTKKPTQHNGIDFAVPENTPIPAPRDGEVSRNDFTDGNGNRIAILDNEGIEHHFFHMSKLSDLPIGACVNKGDIIGYSGNTGRSTGAHVHYETRKKGAFPQNVVDPREEDVDYLTDYFNNSSAIFSNLIPITL